MGVDFPAQSPNGGAGGRRFESCCPYVCSHCPRAATSRVPPPPLPPAAARPPKGDNWLHEPKWDGFRFQIIKDGSVVRSIRATALNTLTASRTWPKAFAMARVAILLAPTLAAELVRR